MPPSFVDFDRKQLKEPINWSSCKKSNPSNARPDNPSNARSANIVLRRPATELLCMCPRDAPNLALTRTPDNHNHNHNQQSRVLICVMRSYLFIGVSSILQTGLKLLRYEKRLCRGGTGNSAHSNFPQPVYNLFEHPLTLAERATPTRHRLKM